MATVSNAASRNDDSERFSAAGASDRECERIVPIGFGAFTVLPGSRTLLRDGKPVEIGSRAFDLLMTLLRSRGEIASRAAIMRQVWPTTIVEDGNLRVQLSALRRALGGERWRIKTIAGRGYLMILDDRPGDEAKQPAMPGATFESSLVLVIDADPERRDHLSRLIAEAGVQVKGFSSLAAFSKSCVNGYVYKNCSSH